MNLRRGTRHALYAALEMARGEQGRAVTVAGVAARWPIPAPALSKVFQRLVRSGIAVGSRGVGGGYRLARPPSAITLLDVIDAIEGPAPAGGCLLGARPGARCPEREVVGCPLGSVFGEVDELERNTLASITLETLLRRTRTQQ